MVGIPSAGVLVADDLPARRDEGPVAGHGEQAHAVAPPAPPTPGCARAGARARRHRRGRTGSGPRPGSARSGPPPATSSPNGCAARKARHSVSSPASTPWMNTVSSMPRALSSSPSGYVAEIWRYPVKSMGGDAPRRRRRSTPSGIPGDRRLRVARPRHRQDPQRQAARGRDGTARARRRPRPDDGTVDDHGRRPDHRPPRTVPRPTPSSASASGSRCGSSRPSARTTSTRATGPRSTTSLLSDVSVDLPMAIVDREGQLRRSRRAPDGETASLRRARGTHRPGARSPAAASDPASSSTPDRPARPASWRTSGRGRRARLGTAEIEFTDPVAPLRDDDARAARPPARPGDPQALARHNRIEMPGLGRVRLPRDLRRGHGARHRRGGGRAPVALTASTRRRAARAVGTAARPAASRGRGVTPGEDGTPTVPDGGARVNRRAVRQLRDARRRDARRARRSPPSACCSSRSCSTARRCRVSPRSCTCRWRATSAIRRSSRATGRCGAHSASTGCSTTPSVPSPPRYPSPCSDGSAGSSLGRARVAARAPRRADRPPTDGRGRRHRAVARRQPGAHRRRLDVRHLRGQDDRRRARGGRDAGRDTRERVGLADRAVRHRRRRPSRPRRLGRVRRWCRAARHPDDPLAGTAVGDRRRRCSPRRARGGAELDRPVELARPVPRDRRAALPPRPVLRRRAARGPPGDPPRRGPRGDAGDERRVVPALGPRAGPAVPGHVPAHGDHPRRDRVRRAGAGGAGSSSCCSRCASVRWSSRSSSSSSSCAGSASSRRVEPTDRGGAAVHGAGGVRLRGSRSR